MRYSLVSCIGLLLLVAYIPVHASFDLGFGSDDDLYSFVTRPELKAPRFTVKKHHPEEITPGYWFIAPYVFLGQERFAQKYYQSCQTGPAIYDQDGELIWSGACSFRNQNACDFRVFSANGSEYLSFILMQSDGLDPIGRGVVLDSSLQVKSTHPNPYIYSPFNMHEFLIIENGTKALNLVAKNEVLDTTDVQGTDLPVGIVANMAAREYDLATGKSTFEWWAHPAIPINASYAAPTLLEGPFPKGWDWIHMNAMDKNEDGDYLVTGRYTDAIYKISGRTGELLWTLSGRQSDYDLEGFIIGGPHDGRFIRAEGEKEIISFLDNGGDEERFTSDTSTAYVVELDRSEKPWKARIIHSWPRPDGDRSDKRGNFQFLHNGNGFVCWSENSYISEHHPDGRVLMEASFTSKRFVTYRAFLSNYTTTPAEEPIVKAFAYGESPTSFMSVYYVSWNGAMNVETWRFVDAETGSVVGEQKRSGFETMFAQSRVLANTVYAEAVALDGGVMGRSDDVAVVRPPNWLSASQKNGEQAGSDHSPQTPSTSEGRDEL